MFACVPLHTVVTLGARQEPRRKASAKYQNQQSKEPSSASLSVQYCSALSFEIKRTVI